MQKNESEVHLESNGPRDEDPSLCCDGTNWTKVPVAIRSGKLTKIKTSWLIPKKSRIIPESLTDSGRSESGSESERTTE